MDCYVVTDWFVLRGLGVFVDRAAVADNDKFIFIGGGEGGGSDRLIESS